MAIKRVARVVCALALITLPCAALADVSDVVLAIHALSGRTEGSLEITVDQGTWEGDNFFWSTDVAIPIMSGSEVLGTFGPGHLELYADPSVALGFSFQSGDVPLSVTISSALLSFPSMPNPAARTSAAATLLDLSGAGAALTGTGPGGFAYRALFEDGSTFASGIPELVVTPPESLAATSFTYPGVGYVPVSPSHTGISAQWSFMVTARAMVSGSSEFEIIPEPASLLLLAVGLGLVRRR
jgi:hypothetical protein